MIAFLARRWFLLVLITVLAAGFTLHGELQPLVAISNKNLIVAAVLFCMALPLDARAMWRAVRHPGPALLATGLNLVAVPLLAWLVSPLLASDLGTGLIIMATIPCTLASAAVWTRRAGGNDAIALMVTMVTNLACFIVTPAWLRVLTSTETALDYRKMATELFVFVVLPILAAQACRLHSVVAAFASRRKSVLGVMSQSGILWIVLLGSIDGGARLATGDTHGLRWFDWGAMLLAVNFVHIAALVSGHLLAHWCGMATADRIAVGFAGSQKTLAVGLALGPQYFSGLTIMPMIAYHVCQLLVDTLAIELVRHEPEVEPAPAQAELPS